MYLPNVLHHDDIEVGWNDNDTALTFFDVHDDTRLMVIPNGGEVSFIALDYVSDADKVRKALDENHKPRLVEVSVDLADFLRQFEANGFERVSTVFGAWVHMLVLRPIHDGDTVVDIYISDGVSFPTFAFTPEQVNVMVDYIRGNAQD